MAGEEVFGDAGLAIEAVESSLRGEADQVAVAFFIFCEDEKVVVLVAVTLGAMIFRLADVEFAAEDGLDALFLGGVEEMDRAEDVAVVGHGDGLLADFVDMGDEFVYVTGSVEEGVIGVEMEMGEVCGHIDSLSQRGVGRAMCK